MSNERTAYIYAIITVLLWSTVATGFKLGLEHLEPVQLLFGGSLIALMIFAVAALREGWPFKGFDLLEGIQFGSINPVVYYLILFEAYDRLPAHIAQPLNYTWAITLALLAIPVLGQPIQRRTGIGIAVSYAGVLLLLSQGGTADGTRIDGLGVMLALVSTVFWAMYWLSTAKSTSPPATLMANSFLIAVPVLAILCWLGPGWPPLTEHTLISALWVGGAEMGIAFLFWQKALRLTQNVAQLGQLIFISPFLSLLMIGAVLREAIHFTAWIGLIVIVAGVIITNRDPGKTARSQND